MGGCTPPEIKRPLTVEAMQEHLPVFPPGVPHLLSELADSDLEYAKLAKLLERFPTIAMRIISVANSAWSSPVSPILSLEDACARLGFNVVRSISIALAISSPFDPNHCPAFDVRLFWGSSLMAAEICGQLADRSGGMDPAVGRTLGLLHNLGVLWLAQYLPEQTDQALSEAAEDPQLDVNKLLMDNCGIGMGIAGGLLGQRLELPELLINAIAEHRSSEPDCCVDLACQLVRIASYMLTSLHHEQDFEPLAGTGAAPNVQLAVFSSAQRHHPRLQELAGTLFA